MSLYLKGSASTFEPAPSGLHPAVCIDVIDLGLVEKPWGTNHMIRIVWSIAEKMDSGKPYIVQKSYNFKLHPKSSLGKDLAMWRGRRWSDAELTQGIDLETLLGKPCYLSIEHGEREGTVYANVVAVLPLPKGIAKPSVDPSYVRKKNRPTDGAPTKHGHPQGEDWQEPPPPTDDDAPPMLDDESVPF